MKRPSFQFYPDAWLSDPGLRRCSSSAKGVWIDLMCLMHGGDPYGHLCTGGHSFTPAEIARVTGESPAKVKSALTELERNGVCSRTAAGVIFSRRMVRDENLRRRRAEGGELGAPHGALGGRPEKPLTHPLTPPLQGVAKGDTDDTPSSHVRARPRACPSPSPSSSPTPEESQNPSGSSPAAGRPLRDPKPRKEATGAAADCRRHWDAEWRRTRLGTDWSWNARDASAVAKILSANRDATPEEVCRRMTRLLEDSDAWIAKNARPALLEDRWSQFAVEVRKNGHAKHNAAEAELARRASLGGAA